MSAVQSFCVGNWRIEPDFDRISSGNEQVRIPPRVMQVLVCLAAHAGEVVTRRQLIDDVWSTRYVTAAALTRSIFLLRKALRDDPKDPSYVHTVPRRGYRLVARVSEETGTAGLTADDTAGCWLVVGERTYTLREGENMIGRAAETQVRVCSPLVSRRHARVTVNGGHITIEDLDSKNGTVLHGQRIIGERPLRDGDVITVGSTVMVFRLHSPLDSTTAAPVAMA